MAATSMAILALEGGFLAVAVAIDALQTSVGRAGIEQRHAADQIERAGELVIELVVGCCCRRIALFPLGSLRGLYAGSGGGGGGGGRRCRSGGRGGWRNDLRCRTG